MKKGKMIDVAMLNGVRQVWAEPVEIFRYIELWVHNSLTLDGVNKHRFTITEAQTGMLVEYGRTKEKAISNARKRLKAIGKAQVLKSIQRQQKLLQMEKQPYDNKKSKVKVQHDRPTTRLTKFERAKAQTLRKYESLILVAFGIAGLDNTLDVCGWCDAYECKECPVYRAEGEDCLYCEWADEWAKAEKLAVAGKDNYIWWLLARYWYISDLRRTKDGYMYMVQDGPSERGVRCQSTIG